jgi:DinB superfamily
MDNRIEKIKKIRLFLIDQIKGLSAEQLNKIPDSFNNNIIWNLTHLIGAQQGICYLRAGQPAIAPDKYIAPFFTNTKPESVIEKKEIEEIKSLFIDTIDKLQTDYDKKIFNEYTPSPNILRVYGIEIKGIDDALEFLLYHEGYHSGYIISLIRLVS